MSTTQLITIILDLGAGLSALHLARTLTVRVKIHDTRLDAHEKRLDAHDERLVTLERS